jgi:hypothetical protein
MGTPRAERAGDGSKRRARTSAWAEVGRDGKLDIGGSLVDDSIVIAERERERGLAPRIGSEGDLKYSASSYRAETFDIGFR